MIVEPSEDLLDHHLCALFDLKDVAAITRSTHRVRNGVRVDRLVVDHVDGSLPLVAKHYFGPLEPGQETRPRLGLADDRAAKPACEFTGLQRLHALSYSATPHARPVRPLHYVENDRLLIMEEFPGTSARDLLDGDLDLLRNALRNGGATLAHGHAMSHQGETRRESPAEVDEEFERLLTFLLDRRSTRLHRRLETWWPETTIRDGRYGPVHGDCSARNLLVSADGDVAWIDGLFRYSAPIYEDVATFTTSTRTTLRTLRRHGLTSRARRSLSNGFVRGYADVAGIVDVPTLARFEVLVLLDRQASLLTATQSMRTRFLLQLTDRELHDVVRSGT